MLEAVQGGSKFRLIDGRDAEASGDIAGAIKIYQAIIREAPLETEVYNRLMILYRREKRYQDELKIIDRAIAAFMKEQQRQQNDLLKGRKNRKQLEELSAAFMKSSGLRDRKGKDIVYPEPVEKWMKRKAVVEKKIKPKK